MIEQNNRELVQKRFTRTATEFATFSLATRAAEASHLGNLALPHLPDAANANAIDLACGPGTFTRAFAPRVHSICGVDLTPALLSHAPAAAAKAGLQNTRFVCGDGAALPFTAGTFDLGVCAYAVHHFAAPERCLAELSRVVKPGGHVTLVDIVVPDGADPNAANAIERARDASHATSFVRAQFESLFADCGLRILHGEIGSRPRSFNDWMQIAGWHMEEAAYVKTRRLLEAHLLNDTSGFAPRLAADDDLSFTQTSIFLIAERV
jgi:ubiquinone/menaquinone biosynthesis C-methylase UbiE